MSTAIPYKHFMTVEESHCLLGGTCMLILLDRLAVTSIWKVQHIRSNERQYKWRKTEMWNFRKWLHRCLILIQRAASQKMWNFRMSRGVLGLDNLKLRGFLECNLEHCFCMGHQQLGNGEGSWRISQSHGNHQNNIYYKRIDRTMVWNQISTALTGVNAQRGASSTTKTYL